SETIESRCKTVYEQAIETGFEPELIIGLSRGGLVPLGYLAGECLFNNRNVKIISVTSYSDDGKRSQLKLLSPLFDHDFEYLHRFKSILIIDDLVDSGNTLSFVI